MKDVVIEILGEVNWDTLSFIFGRLGKIRTFASQKVIFDLSKMSWCRPLGLTTFTSATAFWLKEQGISMIEIIRPQLLEVESYLSRIDFYRILKEPEILKFNRHNPSGRFIEITQLTQREDCSAITSKFLEILALNMQPEVMHGIKNALDFVVSELTENIFFHAQSKFGGFVCCQSYQDTISLAIVDLGIGIQAALAGNPKTADIVREKGALKASLSFKVSGIPNMHRGLGLFWCSKLIARNGGLLKIQSRNLNLNQKSDNIIERRRHFWPGTAIYIDLKKNGFLNLASLFNEFAPPENDYEFLG